MKTNPNCSFAFLTVFALLSVGCNVTPRVISGETKAVLSEQVKQKSYVALIEGFQPLSGESMRLLGQRLSASRNVAVCATSGNYIAHMPIIREAYKNHQLIYIAGYSIGEADAIHLAEACERERIPVEKLFLLDGFSKTKIQSTVREVVDIVGTSPYVFRRSGRYVGSDLEHNTSIKHYKVAGGHLDVPDHAYGILLAKFP